ncbi:MAG TPA: YciI family protein, partial [Polyangiales bacterium]|nr:YciI family protein [Polyangiales bacterium]
MVIIRANKDTEAGILPGADLLQAMGAYNQQLIDAGIMQAGEGLKPSSAGARLKFDNGKVAVTDGPFAEVRELIAGFWIWKVKSKAEAVEWASRIPGGTDRSVDHFGGKFEVELRQVYEAEDFAEISPELVEQENKQRAQ